MPEVEPSCGECNGWGYLEFDELIPKRTFNAVLEFLRSLPTWEGVRASHVVLVAAEVGIPNTEVLQQYLRDHWGRKVDPVSYDELWRHWDSYWDDP